MSMTLPIDVLYNILEKLPTLDLSTCHAVSPQFRSIVNRIMRRRSKRFQILPRMLDTKAKVEDLIEHVLPWVNDLTVGTADTLIQFGMNSLCCLMECPNLEHLTIAGALDQNIIYSPDLALLKSLSIRTIGNSDKFLRLLLNSCSGNLQRLVLEYVLTSGRLLADAPLSLTSVALINVYALYTRNIFKYVKHNPNLIEFTFIKDDERQLNLSALCLYLTQIKRLTLHCYSFENYHSISLCRQLQFLDLSIVSSTYCYSTHSFDTHNSITELCIAFACFKFTEDTAACFKPFKNLQHLTMKLTPKTYRSYLILPYLGRMAHLDTVIITGRPFDYNITDICEHLQNVRHLRVHLCPNRLAELSALTNVRTLELRVIDTEERFGRMLIEREVNSFLAAVANANQLHTVALQTPQLVRLHETTVHALTTFDLREMTVYDTFEPDTITVLIAQLPHLSKFVHYVGEGIPMANEPDIRTLRPGLNIRLCRVVWEFATYTALDSMHHL